MRDLEYPLNGEDILRRKKKIKRMLLEEIAVDTCVYTKVAILGGSTTSEVKDCLELFLLNEGISPSFYESLYNNYFEDAVFENENLKMFSPDIVYIHTSNRNICKWPELKDSNDTVDKMLEEEYQRFELIWESLREKYNCIIIQNNMELPFYRQMGNKEACDYRGRINYINRLNERFYEYARTHENFYISDINYLSANYGLEKWSNPYFWYMFKYALNIEAIPYLAKNISHIIKAIYGKNKKAMALDLDNTLWGGVIGEDGLENLAIGQESAQGQAYLEFQRFLKFYRDMGILLNVCSKNDEALAIDGLQNTSGILRPDDFMVIKANWEAKSQNIVEIAKELNVMRDSIVFIDDNPAEREIVRQQLPEVSVPEISNVENYIKEIEGNGYFELIKLSEDDLNRNQMYKANVERMQQSVKFTDYKEYLRSLEMVATVKPFSVDDLSRIVQLVNKTNQFNLTTKRYTQTEIEQFMASENYITLSARLTDKFGDNGMVGLFVGRIEEDVLHVDLCLMSCRVLKRDLEKAMLDVVIKACQSKDIKEIRGYYYPTAKNGLVKDFYSECGFEKCFEDSAGNTQWKKIVDNRFLKMNDVIIVEDMA